MPDDHEWQIQRIIGERQTSSELEYEVSVQKTLWLPRAMLDIKLVRKYRAEHRAAHGNALQAALYRGHEQIVKLLLDKGADVNAQGGYYGNAL